MAVRQVIEAHYLFGVAYDDIDIVVHPQSIVHSAIETQDSSVRRYPLLRRCRPRALRAGWGGAARSAGQCAPRL